MDYRIERCRALFDWYERHGFPDDEPERVVNAVAQIVLGAEEEAVPESLESRLESLEAAVTKLLGGQEPTEVAAPQRPFLRSNRYADFLHSLHNLTINLEQVGGEVKAEKVAEVLDKMIVDFYESEPEEE